MVGHINQLFPTEQSLAGLDDTMADLNCQVRTMHLHLHLQVTAIEEDMREMVRSQTAVGGDAAAALEQVLSPFHHLR